MYSILHSNISQKIIHGAVRLFLVFLDMFSFISFVWNSLNEVIITAPFSFSSFSLRKLFHVCLKIFVEVTNDDLKTTWPIHIKVFTISSVSSGFHVGIYFDYVTLFCGHQSSRHSHFLKIFISLASVTFIKWSSFSCRFWMKTIFDYSNFYSQVAIRTWLKSRTSFDFH